MSIVNIQNKNIKLQVEIKPNLDTIEVVFVNTEDLHNNRIGFREHMVYIRVLGIVVQT